MGGDLYFRELKMGTVHSSTGFRQDPEGAQRACEGLWPGSLSKSYYFYRFKKYHIWILSFTQLFLIDQESSKFRAKKAEPEVTFKP